MLPDEWKPEDLGGVVKQFLTLGANRIGSDNPWSVTGRSNPAIEYAIGNLRSFEEEVKRLCTGLEKSFADAEAAWLRKAENEARIGTPASRLEEDMALARAAASRKALNEIRKGNLPPYGPEPLPTGALSSDEFFRLIGAVRKD
jgi:hypothetical protein